MYITQYMIHLIHYILDLIYYILYITYCILFIWCTIYHVSYIIHRMLYIICDELYRSSFVIYTYRIWYIIYDIWWIIYYILYIAYHMLYIMYYILQPYIHRVMNIETPVFIFIWIRSWSRNTLWTHSIPYWHMHYDIPGYMANTSKTFVSFLVQRITCFGGWSTTQTICQRFEALAKSWMIENKFPFQFK